MPRVKVQNQNGDFELRDEIRQPLYDTVIQQAAESPIAVRVFFANVQGKSLAQTNLRQNSQLEGQVSFRVLGMCLDAQNPLEANRLILPTMMDRTSLQLRIGEKVYWQGNSTYAVGRLNQISAISRSSGTGEAAGVVVERTYQHYGDVAVQAVNLGGKHYIDIPPLQSFTVTWTADVADFTAADITAATPAASTQMRYITSLKGLLRRPVQ